MRKTFLEALRNTFHITLSETIATIRCAKSLSSRCARGEQHEHVREHEHVGGHEHVRGTEHVGEYEHIGVQL